MLEVLPLRLGFQGIVETPLGVLPTHNKMVMTPCQKATQVCGFFYGPGR